MRTPLLSQFVLAFFIVGCSSAMTARAGVVEWSGDAARHAVQSGQTPQGGGGTTVQTVDLGDVTGTVCDCGEIPYEGTAEALAKPKFSRYTLLAAAALPITLCMFENVICERDGPPKLTRLKDERRDVVPEPATLCALATGLCALAASQRRRRRLNKH
ncbi:MAG TPA: PEP-CTERM sorting domain-containing protein [Pyrinomonadaceae bacterium]|jgi:hypothetical protein